jgi:hypothetical protein
MNYQLKSARGAGSVNYRCGVRTMRCLALAAATHACSTSASGIARASTSSVPASISSARAGSSARISRVLTEPWPLRAQISGTTRVGRDHPDGMSCLPDNPAYAALDEPNLAEINIERREWR